MNDSTTAVVLCAGEATRMRPLSLACPKSLLPFCGRPLLDYTLDQLAASHIREVIIVVGKHSAAFEHYTLPDRFPTMNVRLYHDSPGQGSGGMLKQVAQSITDGTERILAIYGDSLLRVNFGEVVSAHEENAGKGCRATVLWHSPDDLIVPGRTHTNYGILWLTSEGRCVRFREKPPVTEVTSSCASAAVYVLEKSALMELPDQRPADLSIALLEKLAIGEYSPVFGQQLTGGYRYDIGTIGDYVKRQFAALDGEISVETVSPGQSVLFGQGVSVGTGTELLGHIIIGDRVSIGSSCELTDCVVLDGTTIGNDVTMSGVVLGRNCSVRDNAILRHQTALGDFSVVA